MDALLVLLTLVASLGLVGVAAIWLGAESRPGFEDRSLEGDIAV
jgi:hypothetical protein